jgi:hypothetical protein
VCDCESDFFPSAKKRTISEQFVIGMEWESAARALNDRDRQDVLTKVAAIHTEPANEHAAVIAAVRYPPGHRAGELLGRSVSGPQLSGRPSGIRAAIRRRELAADDRVVRGKQQVPSPEAVSHAAPRGTVL